MRSLVSYVCLVSILPFLAGFAPKAKDSKTKPDAADPVAITSTAKSGKGELHIDVTNLVGTNLPARVDLYARGAKGQPLQQIDVPKGQITTPSAAGEYTAFVYVFQDEVPILVDAVDLSLKPGDTESIAVDLVEGNSPEMPLWRFDQDFDLALDRVEIALGTDPTNATSVPGEERFPIKSVVLDKKPGWFRGELHCSSTYGHGTESVAELIKRAEGMGLDFLAITDRNTMQASMDPAFKSNKLILIPAMEWGDEKRGVALVYCPFTMPRVPGSFNHAQAICRKVQAQGGVFAAASPLFSDAPWQWGLTNVNAVEIWCRDYRAVPPLGIDRLDEEYQEMVNGRLAYPIAVAAATGDLSANGQAGLFWDYELMGGMKAGAIGGSRSASPQTPLAKPVTYVYAEEKSLAGIIDGLRQGRTFVSNGLDGPQILFKADVKCDGKVDIPLPGGIIPLHVETQFEVFVQGAPGKKVQVLRNGKTILTKIIEAKNEKEAFAVRFRQTPQQYSVYRVRVVEPAKTKGFGALDVIAQSSPIYAQAMYFGDPDKMWIKIKRNELTNEMLREDEAPMFQSREQITPDAVF